MHELVAAENARVAALRAYGVLDTPNEPAFDAIVKEAALTFGAPFALISLIDVDRQWFKARVGVDVAQTPRAISFCTHAIRSSDLMCVLDAREDVRFANNPNVTGSPFIRFYAGAPLTTREGKRIGTICVFDSRPRTEIRAGEATRLKALAVRVMTLFDMRHGHMQPAARMATTAI